MCSTGGKTATATDYAHLFVMYALKERGQIPEPHPFSVPQWHCCYSQRIFVLWGLRPITKKVCFFLPLALLCMCHHVLGKCFDVILAFCRLVLLRAPLDVEARIQQSACAMLSLNERIHSNEITLIKAVGENYRSVFGMLLGNRLYVTKYLHIHLHTVHCSKNIWILDKRKQI